MFSKIKQYFKELYKQDPPFFWFGAAMLLIAIVVGYHTCSMIIINEFQY